MKKLLVLFAVIVYATVSAFAQKNKVQTAWNYYKYEELDKDVHDIKLKMWEGEYFIEFSYYKNDKSSLFKYEKIFCLHSLVISFE